MAGAAYLIWIKDRGVNLAAIRDFGSKAAGYETGWEIVGNKALCRGGLGRRGRLCVGTGG